MDTNCVVCEAEYEFLYVILMSVNMEKDCGVNVTAITIQNTKIM